MKRMIVLFLVFSILLTSVSFAELEQSPFLDAAFTMIEADNIFLRRYNEITGANVEAMFELGMPYMFGGRAKDAMFSRLPLYSKRQCYETTKFYREGTVYVYGFDCSGYTQWIYSQVGKPAHPQLDDMILIWEYEKTNHVFNHRVGHEMPPYNELKDHLEVGDMLVAKKGARHIMMYIGTLADFGFTAEEVPELADYLDYPLVIHCGPNPFYGDRFQTFIDEHQDYYFNCSTTDGGVCVSILGVPLDAAPYHTHVQVHDYDYFLIDDGNYMLTIWDLPSATSFCWWRE